MIYIILTHLRAMLLDFQKCRAEGDKFDLSAVNLRLFDTGLVALNDVVNAFNGYWVSNDRNAFHREIITASMHFTKRWEDLLAAPDSSSLTKIVRVLHEFIIRHLKGLTKAYRIWHCDFLSGR